MKKTMIIRTCSDLKAHFADEPLLVQQCEIVAHFNTDESTASELRAAERAAPKEEAKVLVYAA